MCGIIACLGPDRSLDHLFSGLENLEYRGYDSAGVAIQNGAGLEVHKHSGRVGELEDTVSSDTDASLGIGHTRWSTHGPPTDQNAHPHTAGDGDIAVVHNGIIENYTELRTQLEHAGHTFTSDTDTEVIPHLIQEFLEDGLDPETAFRQSVVELEGSYAIAAVVADDDTIYAARQGSPLVVGLDDDGYYLASDVPAFLDYTDDVIYLEDGDVAVVADDDDLELTDLDGNAVSRDVTTVDWDPSETGKGAYDHYMLKEINHQPTALDNTIQGRALASDERVVLEDFPPGTFTDEGNLHLVGCGTSYHAAMYAENLLTDGGVDADAYRASEYGLQTDVDEDTLVFAVTQSGETADTLSALRSAREAGATVVTVTNVVGSTAAREAEHTLFIRAGPEIGVAATKTFSSQVVSLALLSQCVLSDVADATPHDDIQTLLDSLQDLPEHIDRVLDSSRADALANRYADEEAYFFIGRGIANAVAKEGALKFKEITYEHAEGFAAGELKHGPLALVTERTPVIAVFTGDEAHDRKTKNNAKEAKTRGAPIVAVAPEGHEAAGFADAHLEVPATEPEWVGLLANVQLQLLSYHAADQLDRPIDKPRNLAKSVTVE